MRSSVGFLALKWKTKRCTVYSVSVQTKIPSKKPIGMYAAGAPGAALLIAWIRKTNATGSQMATTTAGWMCVKNSRKSDLNNRMGTSL